MAATTEKATKMTDAAGEASPSGMSRGKSRLAAIAVLSCVVVLASIGYSSHGSNVSPGITNIVYKEQRQMAADSSISKAAGGDPSTNRRKISGMERLLENEPEPTGDFTKEAALIEKMVQKLQPVSLRFDDDDGEDDEGEDDDVEEAESGVEEGEITIKKKGRDKAEKRTIAPHQILHLHHMKTGGTSIDRLLRCSMNRLKKEANYDVPYYSIHECSRSRFATCLTDPENQCRVMMEKASVMSYCAALKYLDEFGWWHKNNEDHKVKAFTVLRNPVDRVWSMFRFQTKNCYKCQPLNEIYQKLDNGEDTGVDKLCLDQLLNHEVNNLLSTEWPLEVSELDPENNMDHFDLASKMIQESVDNMKGFFTVIGITEELPATAELLGTVFPFMNLDGSDEYETTSQCTLPHANSSPKNNRCGEGNTHWDLPKQPDKETLDLIIKHNALDMELYEAAVAYFDLQRSALNEVV